jgi:hypothetical protein
MPRAGLGLAQSDAGDLGIGVGAPGDREGARFLPAEEQGVLQSDPGESVGRVRELETRTNVARRENAAIARLQPVVDQDARPGVESHAGLLQVQAVHDRASADCDQDGVRRQLMGFPDTRDVQQPLVSPAARPVDLAVQP